MQRSFCREVCTEKPLQRTTLGEAHTWLFDLWEMKLKPSSCQKTLIGRSTHTEAYTEKAWQKGTYRYTEKHLQRSTCREACTSLLRPPVVRNHAFVKSTLCNLTQLKSWTSLRPRIDHTWMGCCSYLGLDHSSCLLNKPLSDSELISNKPSHHYVMAFQNVHTYKDVNTTLWLQGLLQALLPKGAREMALASSV